MSELLEKRYIANPELVLSEEADGCLLFNPSNGEIQAFNESGAYLYGLLIDGCTGLELIESLLNDFSGIERSQAEADVSEFLQMAIKLELVSEVPA